MITYCYIDRHDYDALFPFMSNVLPDVFLPAVFSWSNWLWAYSIYRSRAFPASVIKDVCPEATDGILLPLFDSLNHSIDCQVSWHLTTNDTDVTEHRIAFRTAADLINGAELFNNYGAKGNEELLLCHGFCIEGNVADTVNIKLGFGGPKADELRCFLNPYFCNTVIFLKT